MTENRLLLGCIADDFTGASDAASFIAKSGMETILYNGLPEKLPENMPQAVVIALKSRTAPVDEAVGQSLAAARWLKEAGAKQIYVKYCSTFDSTPKGNIGPVCDSIMEELGAKYSLLCPALPVNGRTVKDGRLFVNGVPLHESSMKDHPLTPMWDDRLSVLMAEQSEYPVFSVNAEVMADGREKAEAAAFAAAGEAEHFYLVPDYYEDSHAQLIEQCFGHLPLLTGGSGILDAAARGLMETAPAGEKLSYADPGSRALILAGSCSAATLGQVGRYSEIAPAMRIYPAKVLDGSQNLADLQTFIQTHPDEDVLIYSSAPADEVRRAQSEGAGSENVSAALEKLMADISKWAAENGRRRIIVAGGETSGAVTRGLGLSSFHIGSSVAPGVPVIVPCERTDMRLVLKSGNFGDGDFFAKAVEMTR